MKTITLALATAALLCSGLSFAGDNSHRRYQTYGFDDHATRYDDRRSHNRANRHRDTHRYSHGLHNDLALFFLFDHHNRGYRDHHHNRGYRDHHRRHWSHHSGHRQYDRHDRHAYKHHWKHQRKHHH